jgi:hypothetical protein
MAIARRRHAQRCFADVVGQPVVDYRLHLPAHRASDRRMAVGAHGQSYLMLPCNNRLPRGHQLAFAGDHYVVLPATKASGATSTARAANPQVNAINRA